jgi:multiple sugar transport system substrate-binding protein
MPKFSQSCTLVILTLVILASAGCRRNEHSTTGVVTITFWHSFVASTVPALNDLLQKFNDEHPGIEVKAQYVPTGDALLQKLITAVQSKTAPDISWIHSTYMQNLIEADAIYKMDEFVHGPDSLAMEDFLDIYPALREQASWRKELYSLPMEATNLGLVYNKELFRQAGLDPERPPKTWDELYDYARKLTVDKDGDGRFDQSGFFIPIFPASGPLGDWMVWQWYPFLWQAGGYEINIEQTEALFNSDAGVKALTLWKRIYDDLKLRSVTADYDAAFAGQKLAMALDGPWSIPLYSKLKHIDWAIAPLPAGPTKAATVVGGEYLVLFKQSKHPDAAWTFIKWLLKPEVQAFWSMKSGYLPVRHAAMNVEEYRHYLNENPPLRAFVEQMDVGQASRPVDYYGLQLSKAIAEAIEKATVGGEDPKKVLDESAAKVTTLLRSVARK